MQWWARIWTWHSDNGSYLRLFQGTTTTSTASFWLQLNQLCFWQCHDKLKTCFFVRAAWTGGPVLAGFWLVGFCLTSKKCVWGWQIVAEVLFSCQIARLWCAERVESSLLHKLRTFLSSSFWLTCRSCDTGFLCLGKTCEQTTPAPHFDADVARHMIPQKANLESSLTPRPSFIVLIEPWCALLWTWPIPTQFSPFPTLEGLTRRMPAVDYSSRSHQSQTARLLTLRHLSEKWTQTHSREHWVSLAYYTWFLKRCWDKELQIRQGPHNQHYVRKLQDNKLCCTWEINLKYLEHMRLNMCLVHGILGFGTFSWCNVWSPRKFPCETYILSQSE